MLTSGKMISLVTQMLGLYPSGIGGKRSAGLRKFNIDDPIYLDAPYSDGLEALADLLKTGRSVADAP